MTPRGVPHRRRTARPAASAVLLALACGGAAAGCRERPADAPETTPIRIGWQVPWATQGQVAHVLQRTNVLELNGLRGKFLGFSYGGPLNEAALAGEVDALFTADQPAAMLLARSGDWKIAGRLMYNRVAMYVPPESGIRTVSGLRGRRVGVPFGAAAQRDAMKAVADAGLDPRRDVTWVNLDIYEQGSVVSAGSAERWPGVDALVGFDPTPAIFERRGVARMLHVGQVVSVVLVSKSFAEAHPEAAAGFLGAVAESFYYYARNQRQVNGWFIEGSRLDVDPAVLDVAASVEPNVRAASIRDVRLQLTDADLRVLQEAADFIHRQGLVPTRVVMADHVDPSYARTAMQRLASLRYDPARVQRREPRVARQ